MFLDPVTGKKEKKERKIAFNNIHLVFTYYGSVVVKVEVNSLAIKSPFGLK